MNKFYSIFLILFAAFSLAFIAGCDQGIPTLPAIPEITWHTKTESRTIGNGSANMPLMLRFESSAPLYSASLELSSTLKPFVVLPADFPAIIEANSVYEFTINFRIPKDASQGSYSGEIFLTEKGVPVPGQYSAAVDVDYGNIVLTDKVRQLSEDTVGNIMNINSDFTEVVFKGQPDELANLAAGDILAFGGNALFPMGFTRKVIAVSGGSNLTLTLTDPEFGDIIYEGNIRIDQPLFGALENVSPRAASRASINLGTTLCLPVEDIVLFDLDGNNSTTHDQIRLNLESCMTLGVRFEMDVHGLIDDGEVDYLRFLTYGGISGEIEASALVEKDFLDAEIGIPTGLPPLMLIPVPVGPVVLTFAIKPYLAVGARGTFFAGLVAGISYELNMEAGFEYTASGGWNEIHNFDSLYNPLTIRPAAGVEFEGYFKFGLKTQYLPVPTIPWLGVDVGPTLSLKIFNEFTADIFANPWWELSRGYSLIAGFKVGVPFFNLVNWEQPHPFTVKVPLCDAGGPFLETTPTPVPTISPEPTTALLADLIPTNITYPSSAIAPGASVYFDTGIRNAGNRATGIFNIAWYVDGVRVGYGSHSAISAGATVMNGNTQFNWTAQAGTHTISFVVDEDNHVSESNEGNNRINVTVNVSGNSVSTDLIPTAITYPSSALTPGASVYFDTGIRNAGNTSSGIFNIAWYVDGVRVGYGSHLAIAAGATVMKGNTQFDWTAQPGTHTISFVVDEDNHVSESNEGNNQVSVTVTVRN